MTGVTTEAAPVRAPPLWASTWWRRVGARYARRRRLIGIESDGFGFRAALLETTRGRVRVERVATGEAVEPRVALPQILAALRESGGDFPREAILLTPTAIAAVLALPVTPARPRSYEHMQGMIRWELEPFFVRRVGVWRLGQILVRRGHLAERYVSEVLQEAEHRREDTRRAGRARSLPTLFGEVAVERGLVSAIQRDEALSIQQHLQVTDDELVCGWSPQASSATAKHPWLVCGLGRAERGMWVELFAEQGLRLERIYPLVGCSAAALNGSVAAEAAVIEIRAGVMGCMRLDQGQVTSLDLFYTAGRGSSEPLSPALADQEGETLYLSGDDQRVQSLSEALAVLGRQTARLVPNELEAAALPPGVAPTALTGILGAARHAWRLAGGSRAVSVPARDPSPPLRQRVEVWWISMAIGALALIAAAEATQAWRVASTGARQATALNAVASLRGEQTGIEERQAKLAERQKAVDDLTRQLDEATGRKAFVETDVLGRAAQVLALLDALARALPRDMVLEQLAADDRGDVRLEGWGVSEQVLRDFASQVAASIAPLHLRMVDLQASPQPGRRGVPGFRLKVRLTPISPSAPAPQPASGAAP